MFTEETVEHLEKHTEQKITMIEPALDTTKEWNINTIRRRTLKHFRYG